ncbi:MAG: hypothetical protein ABFQ82_03905 [Thermodesulfobacteriota bacterium]
MSARSTMGLLIMMTAGWAGKALANGEPGHDDPEASIFKLLIVPLGVATFVSIVTTLTLGLKMARNRAAIFPWHRRMAICTMLLALCHATLVIIFH